jgi:hypothetical protein
LKLILGKNLEGIAIGKSFLTRNPLAQKIRTRIERWDFMKLQKFFTEKRSKNHKSTKRMVG